MASSSKILSLSGKGLKLDTRADIEPHLKSFDPTIIEEIHLGGNTLGVDASIALSEFLQKATVLKVPWILLVPNDNADDHIDRRLGRHLHWSPDLRDSPRFDCNLRCTERQDVSNRAKPQRQRLWRPIGGPYRPIPHTQPKLSDPEAEQQRIGPCGRNRACQCTFRVCETYQS